MDRKKESKYPLQKVEGKAMDKRIKHGAYTLMIRRGKIDNRYRIAKEMQALKKQLHNDMGGVLSTSQLILLERVVSKTFQVRLLEAAILSGKRQAEKNYLALANSLRLDLLALGLQRKAKEITLDQYLEKKVLQQEESKSFEDNED